VDTFYLGTHEPSWLGRVDVPLMVSRVRLIRGRTAPRAQVPWVLDSGAFSELVKYGRYTFTPRQYADEVAQWSRSIGRPDWVAPMDHMCEPWMLERTGSTVGVHQARTVANYLELKALRVPVIPVLQGYTVADYARCVDRYVWSGVDLFACPTVGLGSVCRRENTDEIGAVVAELVTLGLGGRLHGFGCKAGAVIRYGHYLQSADSLAWSYAGRRRGPCTHLRSRCANHLHYALAWRDGVLAGDDRPRQLTFGDLVTPPR